MRDLKLKASLAYDAMCICALDENLRNMFLEPQEELAQMIESGEYGSFQWPDISFSVLNGILYSADTTSAEWSISQLKEFFRTTKHEMLSDGKALAVLNNLEVLERMGFENFWEEKILPLESESISKFVDLAGEYDLSRLFDLLCKLKKIESIDSVTVYVSATSYPISFTLSNDAFVYNIPDEYDIKSVLSMISHELMHGFASEELINKYRDLINSCLMLRSKHRDLIEHFCSGDEEEFVMAAEYYLVYKAGIMTFDEIINRNVNRYGGTVPFSFYLFDMIRENEINGYNEYLLELFNKKINHNDIFAVNDRILSIRTDEEGFYNRFFFWLEACASVIREIETDDIPDIQERMECLASAKFEDNDDNVVKSIFSENIIDLKKVNRRTLKNGRLKIEAIKFPTKKEAFLFFFRRNGANIGTYPVEYEGETFNNPYLLNLTFPDNEPLRVEFSFVCGTTRYLITAECPSYVVKKEKFGKDVIPKYSKEIMTEVKKAASFILMLDEQL